MPTFSTTNVCPGLMVSQFINAYDYASRWKYAEQNAPASRHTF